MKIKHFIYSLGLMFMFLLMLCSYNIKAQPLDLKISGGYFRPISININRFSATTSEEKLYALRIQRIINDNLGSTGLFFVKKVLETEYYDIKDIANVNNLAELPDFSLWKNHQVQVLQQGTLQIDGDKLTVKLRLWDIELQQQLYSTQKIVKVKYWQRLAHVLSDLIYSKLIGTKGMFNSKILFIDEQASSYGNKNVEKRLAIMDYNGANLTYLSSGEYMVLSPRMSHNNKWASFLAYYYGRSPKVFLLELENGNFKPIRDIPGQNILSAQFSEDSKHIVYSVEEDSHSSISMLDLVSHKVTKLVDSKAINISPSLSPDNSYMVYSSDISGHQAIYKMNMATKEVVKISKSDKDDYATPIYSPDGEYIAFTKRTYGMFYIGTMDPEGENERILASGFLVENPSWAPNSHNILYTKEILDNKKVKHSYLYTVDISGIHEHRMTTPHDAFDGSWSSLLQ